MIAETLSLDFVGNAAGLQDAVMASQRALQALNRDSSRFSFSIGRVMRTIVTPIASIILSAFAAKKALADFTQSGLPGVTRFNQTLGLMRISMFRLSSAVGELLAPAAERAARIVTMIADKLEPIIRKITATIPSLAAFFKQLGSNLLAALRPLMPTVFALIESVIGNFKAIDWESVWESLKSAWFRAWNAVLNFMAPIVLRIATLIETVVRVGQELLSSLAVWFSDLMSRIAAYFGITLPGAVSALQGVVAALQAGIIVVIAAIEIAVQNLPLLFSLVAEAGRVAIEFLQKNWEQLAVYMQDVFVVVFQNMGTLIGNVFAQLSPIFVVVAKNIGDILFEVFRALVESLGTLWDRMSLQVSVALIDGFVRVFEQIPLLGFGKIAKALKSLRRGILSDEEVKNQTPVRGPQFNMPELRAIPGIDLNAILNGLKDLPKFPPMASNLDKMNIILQAIRDKFGPGIAALLEDALKRAPQLAGQILANLPAIGGMPGARVDRFEAIGPLLFGTSAANARETNVGSKNPLVPIAQQQLALTREQLVQQRAAARAAERKARLANF